MNKKKLIIIGTSGTSEVIADLFMRDSSFELTAFSVEKRYLPASGSFMGLPAVPYEELNSLYPSSDYAFFVGIGGTELNLLRSRFFNEMITRGYTAASFISSRASVSPRATLGVHCCVLENVTIHAGYRIGANVIIFPGTYTGHHTHIDDHCFIASGVVIAGYAKIGAKSFIGAGAAVANSLHIGERNFICMGARVTRSTAPGTVLKPEFCREQEGAEEAFSRWHKRAAAATKQVTA